MTEYSGGYAGYSYESGCDHSSITEVMKIGEVAIWAGSRIEVERESNWALIVTLLGHPSAAATQPVKMNKEAQAILPVSLTDWTPTPILSVDWPDGGVPAMRKEWWGEFYAALASGKIKGDVAIHCQGGHGRTGATLAILAAMAGFLKKGCPVLWVRKAYCAKAVETYAQIKYVEEMTGVKVKAQSSAAIQAQKKETEEKERARKAAQNPTQGPSGTQPLSGPHSGKETKDEWVWDRASNSLVRKSELDQDWDGSHWGRML